MHAAGRKGGKTREANLFWVQFWLDENIAPLFSTNHSQNSTISFFLPFFFCQFKSIFFERNGTQKFRCCNFALMLQFFFWEISIRGIFWISNKKNTSNGDDAMTAVHPNPTGLNVLFNVIRCNLRNAIFFKL